VIRPGEIASEHASRHFKVYPREARRLKDVVVARRRSRPTEVRALEDVSFHVEPGSAIGLVGRNGSGKTTLLRLLSGIIKPTSGSVDVGGRVGSLLELGAGFHPDMTGRENVFLNGSILGMKRREIESRFDEIVEFSGIERFLDTPVKRYSSGMYVRLAFAVAAHLEPEILLVDEVLAVGDGEFQRKCLGKMRDVAGEGRAVVFVSHNLHAVQRLCTRALFVEGGQVQMSGSPPEVVAAYSDSVESNQAGGVAHIHDDVARFGTGEVGFRRVSMTRLDGAPLSSVYLGQPFRVTLACEVLEVVPEAAFEVGISTVEGDRVATAQSIDLDRPTMTLEEGECEITATLDVTLLPGEYALDVGVHDARRHVTIDWVERALRFTALNEAEVGGDHYPWQGVRGYVRPTSSWERAPARPLGSALRAG
jgi:lipopolysaccharide transport system ATP-binding protein